MPKWAAIITGITGITVTTANGISRSPLDPHCPRGGRGYSPACADGAGRHRLDNRDANSILPANVLRLRAALGIRKTGCILGSSAKRAAILLLPLALAACAGDGQNSITYTDDRGVANQPYPTNYRPELLAFMKTYLNNPVGVKDAAMAEPVQRTVGGRLRYVVCLRYNAKDTDGSYRGARERAILYVDARLDRIVEDASETCAGAAYAPFAELEKMTR
jgi:hypothetical protein